MHMNSFLFRFICKACYQQDATLSQGGPRDAAVNFGTHMNLKFRAASHSFCCDSNAFELNNSISHGKLTFFKYIYLLPLNSLFDSHCVRL